MAKGNYSRRKETKKPKKNSKKVKGNGYSRNLTRTYPGIVGLPTPDIPGTGREVQY